MSGKRAERQPSSLVVALAGPMESGKSRLAGLLARELRAPQVSFGRLVRARHPEAQTRAELQEAGAELLRELGPDAFVLAAVEVARVAPDHTPVIWEGVRHREVLEALRRLYGPGRVRLFYLAPPEPERQQRALAAAGGDPALLREWAAHSTEQIEGLREVADLVVDDASPESAVTSILARLPAR